MVQTMYLNLSVHIVETTVIMLCYSSEGNDRPQTSLDMFECMNVTKSEFNMVIQQNCTGPKEVRKLAWKLRNCADVPLVEFMFPVLFTGIMDGS